MAVSLPWNGVRKILCVRLDTIGDVLMTTPAVRALKESFPEASVTLLTSRPGADIAALVPEIDRTLVYQAPWMKQCSPSSDSAAEYAMADTLRRDKFDAAAIFTVYSQNPLPSAFLCHLADIPRRLAHCHENPYRLLTTWVPDPEPQKLLRHEVQRQLDLVREVGARTRNRRMSLRISEGAKERVRNLLEETGVDLDRCWIVIHPGATAPSRRYPPEYFATAARRMIKDTGLQIVFTGTAAERELIENIQDMMGFPSFSLVGKLNIAELAALIAQTPLLISNNTGPVHIAAALGVQVVDIYALTNPQHTPWGVRSRVLSHDVPCKYCYKSECPEGHHECLRLVSPAMVAQAALELLNRTFQKLPNQLFPKLPVYSG